MTYRLFSPPYASIFALILISLFSSNAIDSVSGQSSNSARSQQNEFSDHQAKVIEELSPSKNVNVFKTKVDPTQDTEMAITGSSSLDSSPLMGIGYLGPDEDYHYKNGMVFLDEKQNEDPVREMILNRCDEDFDPRCQFAYVADEYGRSNDGILEPSYGQREIGLDFESSKPVPSKRRLRFVKRRLRFIKRDDDEEKSSLDKRRLRFVKKDDEENSVSKRRLRFVKRRLRFHKRNYGGAYPSSIEESVVPDYEDSIGYGYASPRYYDLVQPTAMKEQNKLATDYDDVINTKISSLDLPRMYSSSHKIKRRSTPTPDFSGLDTFTFDPTLVKRYMSINQPMQLITNMVVAKEQERRMEQQRQLANLLKLGKRSDMLTPKNDNTIFSKVLTKFVQSYLSRPNDQSDYSI